MKKEFLLSGKRFFVNEAAPLVSGDTNCYELVFYAPCDLHDATFTVTATRADGKVLTGMGQTVGKTARYMIDNSMYQVPGSLKLRTVITAAEGSVITANEITFEVIEGVNSDKAVEADTNYPVLTQLILKVQEIMNTMPEVKELIETAESITADAEIKAIFANAAAEQAKNAADRAEAVSEKAEWFMEKVDGIKDALPPAFTANDEGKILFLSRNGMVSEIASASASYSLYDNVISDAGLLDEETAFIDISGAELYNLGISDPLDDRCAFGFQLMPDNLDYTTDFDVMVESVEETDGGYRMLFLAERCTPFAENNIQSASDLFAFFEAVQLNADYPKDCLTPTWGREEDVFSPAFLDKYVISPAVNLAKDYTDQKTNFTVTIRDKKFGMSGNFSLDGITKGVKKLELTFATDLEENNSTLKVYYFPEDGSVETLAGMYSLPENLKKGDRILFDTIKDMCIVYPAENPASPYYIAGADEFLYVLKNKKFNRVYLYDTNNEQHSCEVEYYVAADYMIDDKIKSAIVDSWEVAV